MILTLVNVLFVLVAVAMIILILLQRGAGAAAGSGFGAGASATVFGSRGASNFLSKSTAILAALFMLISLGMAVYLHKTRSGAAVTEDIGIMGAMPAAAPASEVPTATGDAPVAPASDVPAVPVDGAPAAAPAATPATESAAPAANDPAPAQDVEAAKKDDNGA